MMKVTNNRLRFYARQTFFLLFVTRGALESKKYSLSLKGT